MIKKTLDQLRENHYRKLKHKDKIRTNEKTYIRAYERGLETIKDFERYELAGNTEEYNIRRLYGVLYLTSSPH